MWRDGSLPVERLISSRIALADISEAMDATLADGTACARSSLMLTRPPWVGGWTVTNEGVAMDINEILGSVPTGLFIAGQWRDAEGGGRFDVLQPREREVLASVADGSPADGMAASTRLLPRKEKVARPHRAWARARSCAPPSSCSWTGRRCSPRS